MKLFHNPKCSKSRAALALLQEKGVDVDIVTYLDTPPDEADFAALLDKLTTPAISAIRFGEDIAKELGLSADDDRDVAAWAKILAQHPRLLERPIAVVGERAVVGRPPELILELLS